MENDRKLKDENEKFNVNNLYTPLSVAREEIWRRWNNKELKKKVDDFLEGDMPEFLKYEPKAYLGRQIASPNFECIRFLELSDEIGLNPVIPEFKKDKYTMINPVKYYFANLRVENEDKTHNVINIVDEDYFNGKKLCDVKTLWGEDLIQFHHEMFRNNFNDFENNIFDISEWFSKNGRRSGKFYIYLLSLFVRNAVLFENYLDSGEEGELFRKIVLPSFRKVEEIFGCKPLIVQLLPEESEKNPHWYSYDNKINSIIKK